MSSSRVHTSFTGLSPPMAFATAAASPATSPFGVARRPKLPPASSVLTRTLVGGKPRVLATTKVRVDRKSTRLNSSHDQISYAVFCLKKKNKTEHSAADIAV